MYCQTPSTLCVLAAVTIVVHKCLGLAIPDGPHEANGASTSAVGSCPVAEFAALPANLIEVVTNTTIPPDGSDEPDDLDASIVKRTTNGPPKEVEGRATWAKLQRKLNGPSQPDAPCSYVEERWTKYEPPNPEKEIQMVIWGQIYPTFLNVEAPSLPWRSDPLWTIQALFNWKDATKFPFEFFEYRNAYSPNAKAIIELDYRNTLKIEGSNYRAPDYWSDVTWTAWRKLCGTQGKDVADLSYILEQGVSAESTKDLIEWAVNPSPALPLTLQNPTDAYIKIRHVTPDDSLFYTLLQTETAARAVMLLMRHTEELRKKTIESIRVVMVNKGSLLGETEYHLSVDLVPFLPGPPPGPPPKAISNQTS